MTELKSLFVLPEGFDPQKKYPLVIYLHGSGSRGNDVEILKSSEIVRYRYAHPDFPAVLYAPQCPVDTWYDVFESLISAVDRTAALPFVDPQRISLTGVSMGGYAAWQLTMSRSRLFAAAVILCGGGMYWNAAKLRDIPVLAFHGALDKAVLPSESEHMTDAVNAAGGNAVLTVFPDLGHGIWTRVYSDSAVYHFLFSHSRKTDG